MKCISKNRINQKFLLSLPEICENCYFWEREKYIIEGYCRIYPHPREYRQENCENWKFRYTKNWYDDWLLKDL